MVFQVHIYCHVIQVLFGTASVLLANSTKCPRDGGGGGCFGRRTKFFQKSGDFAGNRRLRNVSGKYHIVLGHSRKKWDIICIAIC